MRAQDAVRLAEIQEGREVNGTGRSSGPERLSQEARSAARRASSARRLFLPGRSPTG